MALTVAVSFKTIRDQKVAAFSFEGASERNIPYLFSLTIHPSLLIVKSLTRLEAFLFGANFMVVRLSTTTGVVVVVVDVDS